MGIMAGYAVAIGPSVGNVQRPEHPVPHRKQNAEVAIGGSILAIAVMRVVNSGRYKNMFGRFGCFQMLRKTLGQERLMRTRG